MFRVAIAICRIHCLRVHFRIDGDVGLPGNRLHGFGLWV